MWGLGPHFGESHAVVSKLPQCERPPRVQHNVVSGNWIQEFEGMSKKLEGIVTTTNSFATIASAVKIVSYKWHTKVGEYRPNLMCLSRERTNAKSP